MSETARKILYILDQTKQVHVEVSELTPYGSEFPSTNSPDGKMKCHRFMGKYADFPHPVYLQWCNPNPDVAEFKNGDTILIQPRKYVAAHGIQSVEFLSVVNKPGQRQQMEAIISKPSTPAGERRVPENTNPAVMGSLWSIAMGHAINYYKDRKDSTEEKVLAFAQRLHEDYHKVML